MLHKTLTIILLLLCIALTASAQDRPILQTDAAQTAWREDLKFMYEKMQTAHPNLFWRTPEADFKKLVADLDADIPYLTDEQIKVRLMQIVALVDGHTQIGIFQPALNFHMYGLRLYAFADGIYVVDAQPQYKEAVGKKLVAIGSTDVESVFKQVSTVAQHDNDNMLMLTTNFYTVVPEVIHALGLTRDMDHPAFIVEDDTGQRLTFNPQPLT
ncbi:MAG: hypothetical protein GC179_06805 [Anaerolineaceae bacterium]|nr:hypothetical protein [Anaerolineaceae bacterium]